MTISSLNLKDKKEQSIHKSDGFAPFILNEGRYIITTVEIITMWKRHNHIATPTERDEVELEGC